MKRFFWNLLDELNLWRRGWSNYLRRHVERFSRSFEEQKDGIVDILMARRGMYQRPFMHFSLLVLFGAGVLSAPILADTYPGQGVSNDVATFTPASAVVQSLDFSSYAVETEISEKPRDQVIEHVVSTGDTLSQIADSYQVSVDTIRWVNNIKGDSLSIGQALQIPPVTGIVHKVREGDTVYSIAKKYKTEAQKIVNFPFNDFTDLDTFALTVGQSLVVPDGVVEQAAPAIARRPAAPPPAMPGAGGSGQFMWPTGGLITQYPVWYHMALDIANREAPGIAAAGSGTVLSVQYLKFGYGSHIILDNGGGFTTLYAHLSEIYVQPGDRVNQGQIIGKMGSTGRSTGTHLHFEVRVNGKAQNPLSYLK